MATKSTSPTKRRSPSKSLSAKSAEKKPTKSVYGRQKKVEHDPSKTLRTKSLSQETGTFTIRVKNAFNGMPRKSGAIVTNWNELRDAFVSSAKYGDLEIEFFKAKKYELEWRDVGYGKDKMVTKFNGNSSTMDLPYDKLVDFIQKNSATFRKYVTGKFMCGDFAAVLYKKAAKAGIRCANVSVLYNYGTGHAFNLFLTPDRGAIFVDLTRPVIYDESEFVTNQLPRIVRMIVML